METQAIERTPARRSLFESRRQGPRLAAGLTPTIELATRTPRSRAGRDEDPKAANLIQLRRVSSESDGQRPAPDATTPLSDSAIEQRQRAQRPERPVSLLVYHRDGARRVALSAGAGVVVGRDPEADVPISDESLSRRHARFSLDDGVVSVEDLGSTNGTRVNGRTVETSTVAPGDEVTLGAVTVSVHVLARSEMKLLAPEGDDRFRGALAEELARARYFGRSFALVMLRAFDRRESRLSRWYPRVQALLRPVDRIALYSDDTVEILMPEANAETAMALAKDAAAGARRTEPQLGCGVALFPDAATSSETLIAAALGALRRADAAQPVVSAARDSSRTLLNVADEGSAPPPDEAPVSESSAMREVIAMAERLARSVIVVLLVGETGSGKEVVARILHARGPRRQMPMVCVNCAAIPQQLVESTLFGHEKGAFTGAIQQHKGVFEAAHGGTVFLDEVGELPLPAQAALLRVLETKRIARIGSSREIAVDVRVVAATHRDLEAMSDDGSFRVDLLYRLNGVSIRVPPLRERREDIRPLALSFLAQASRTNDANVVGIDPQAFELLERYAWPGNVRELRNAIERAVVLARADTITPVDLPERVRQAAAIDVPADAASEHTPEPTDTTPPPDGAGAAAEAIDYRSRLARLETDLLLEALRACDWNQTETARRLKLPLRTLVYRMKVLGIKKLGFGQ